MMLSLLLLLAAGLSSCSSSSSQLLEISFDDLAAGSRLADIKRALREVGGLAVTGLGRQLPAYSAAMRQLRATAADCMTAVSEDQSAAVRTVELEDGLRRRSIVQMDNGEQQERDVNASEDWPACLRAEMDVMSATFDLVEQELVAALGRLLGNQTLLVATPEESGAATGDQRLLTVHSLPELAAKTHVHVYDHNNIEKAEKVVTKEDGSLLSMPFHLDNGLYLLLTPSPVRPLQLKSRNGRLVRTEAADPDDTVIFLLGRGLTDWLLLPGGGDSRYRHLVPALHAVPSLLGTPPSTTRSVVARMRVAPLSALPAASLLSNSRSPPPRRFGDVFFDGEIRQSASSLCYFGGPLNYNEDRRRSRRHTADCWPHTQKC